MDKTFDFEKKYECNPSFKWSSPVGKTTDLEAKVPTSDKDGKGDDNAEDPEMGRWGHWESTSTGDLVWVDEEVDDEDSDSESTGTDEVWPFDDDDIEWPRSGDSGWCTRLGALL